MIKEVRTKILEESDCPLGVSQWKERPGDQLHRYPVFSIHHEQGVLNVLLGLGRQVLGLTVPPQDTAMLPSTNGEIISHTETETLCCITD